MVVKERRERHQLIVDEYPAVAEVEQGRAGHGVYINGAGYNFIFLYS